MKKWTTKEIETLKTKCKNGRSNKEMAEHFGVKLEEIHAIRSKLGITRAKIAAEIAKEKRCACCGKQTDKTTMMIMPNGEEFEFCSSCEAVNDFIAAHQS